MKTIKQHANGKVTIEGITYGKVTEAQEDYKHFITIEGENLYPQGKKEKKGKMELLAE
jgi:hypothetical protein